MPAARFERAQESLRQGGELIRAWHPGSVPLPVAIFHGDKWQLLVTEPRHALRVALFMRAFLRAEAGADTRCAIAIGAIESIPATTVAAGRGDAFRLSGVMLNWRIPSGIRFAITSRALQPAAHPLYLPPEDDDERIARGIATMLGVLDLIAKKWTGAQGRAICGALLEETQDEIAGHWRGGPISQQAVQQHLTRAGWDGVRDVLDYFEGIASRWSLDAAL